MKTYEVRDIFTKQIITVRARNAQNAAKRMMKSRCEAMMEAFNANRTGGVFSLWKGNRLVTKVAVYAL